MKDIDTKIQRNVLEIIRNEYPKSPSLERTKVTIKEFQWMLKKISDPNTSIAYKKHLAAQAVPIQRSIKKLKETMPENKFFLFYKNVVEGQSMKSLAAEYGIDTKTISRAKNLAYRQLSVLLYPDLVIGEIFTVGW